MLAPDGRAVLLDALRPPEGHALGVAVATTFTLDLTAALVVPLAFATSQLGESRDPIAVMEAVRSTADRVTVFCQAGNIVVPPQASDLVEFVDPMIHEVRRPRPGRLFHPKLWILRFDDDEGAARYRTLVVTRNLTLDRSWDLIVRLDDDPSATRRNKDNDQLVRLLHDLPRLTTSRMNDRRLEELTALADELRYVTWDPPEGVDEVRFWTLGLGRLARPDMSGYRGLVMSPFLTEGGIEPFLDARDLTIVSRADELDRLQPSVLADVDVYALDPLVGYGDPNEVEPVAPEDDDGEDRAVSQPSAGNPPGLRDLHAKLYIAERARRAHVFVGSANATDAAFGGNIEVLCELVGGHTKLGVASILDAERGLAALFQTYAPGAVAVDEELEQLERQLDELLRAAAELTYRAQVRAADSQWSVAVGSSGHLPVGAVQWSFAPLNRAVEQHTVSPGSTLDVEFGPRLAADISAFYLLTAHPVDNRVVARSTVVRAELVGAPSSRLDEIIARQVDTPEKFLRFLLLLLGAGGEFAMGLVGQDEGTADGRWQLGTPGIFELLATTLASRPGTLRDVAALVERLSTTDAGRAVLPEGWTLVWSAFTDALSQLGPQL